MLQNKIGERRVWSESEDRALKELYGKFETKQVEFDCAAAGGQSMDSEDERASNVVRGVFWIMKV